MSNHAPLFPTAIAALAPLRAEAERRDSNDFSALWAGQAAALGREMSAESLTETLIAQTLARFKDVAT